jgi:hypothetical protein
MRRIYLDTNIFSQMRSFKEGEFSELKSILESERKQFFYLFSKAHIDDLQNDKTDHRIDSLILLSSFALTTTFFTIIYITS